MQYPGHWQWMAFDELSVRELYAILRLRSAIFVVEQACAYQDPDDLDFEAMHCLYTHKGELLAYQRSMAPGLSYGGASAIGRIIVAESARGQGLGQELVRRGIDFNRKTWPDCGIEISAQAHLQSLYESLGFSVCSEPYLEDGIPHLHMQIAAR